MNFLSLSSIDCLIGRKFDFQLFNEYNFSLIIFQMLTLFLVSMDSELFQEQENILLYERTLDDFVDENASITEKPKIVDPRTPVKAQFSEHGTLKLASWTNRT